MKIQSYDDYMYVYTRYVHVCYDLHDASHVLLLYFHIDHHTPNTTEKDEPVVLFVQGVYRHPQCIYYAVRVHVH